MRLPTLLQLAIGGAIGTATLAMPLRAQSDTSKDESHQVPPTLASGVTVGALRFAGGRTENAMAAILLFRPVPWLRLSTAPGFAHTSLGNVSTTGLTDIPFNAAAVYGFEDATWSPSVAGGLSATVSPGDSSAAIGLGRSAVEAMAAFTVSPTDRLDVSADFAHPLTANSGNGSLSLESSMSFGRTTGSLGMSAEMGRADSAAVLSRSLAAGVAYSLSGPLTLTVDASHGLTGSAPTWALSIGIGTAFAGVSPLSPTSALRRLKNTLGSKTSGTSGYAKTSGGVSSCKRAGTC
jgi:Putative MetA-pathway of phenol degradation